MHGARWHKSSALVLHSNNKILVLFYSLLALPQTASFSCFLALPWWRVHTIGTLGSQSGPSVLLSSAGSWVITCPHGEFSCGTSERKDPWLELNIA